MDLNEIVVFARVVETGGFTAAAQSLGLPKSTVSRKIAQLEERLGARLLQRTTRKLSLTEIGKAYHERCARIVADIAAAEQLVADMEGSPRGLLRITAPIDFGGLYLGRLVAEFLAEQPAIQIELVLSDRVFDLVDERLDLAIRFGPLPDSSLVARRLGSVTSVVCAAPSYLERRGTPTVPADLHQHEIVAFVPVTRFRTWNLRGANDDAVELTLPPRLIVNSLFAVRESVRSGAGVSMLPDFTIGDDLQRGDLVRLLPEWSGPPGEISVVYPSTRNLSPKLRTFLDFLTARLTPAPWSVASGR
jgi:DNA-binding transcriptional LysR family regulator